MNNAMEPNLLDPPASASSVTSHASNAPSTPIFSFPKGSFGSGSPENATPPCIQRSVSHSRVYDHNERPQKRGHASCAATKRSRSLSPINADDSSDRFSSTDVLEEQFVTISRKEYDYLKGQLSQVHRLEEELHALRMKLSEPLAEQKPSFDDQPHKISRESATEWLKAPSGRSFTMETSRKGQSPVKSRPRTGTFPPAIGKDVTTFDGCNKPEFDAVVGPGSRECTVVSAVTPQSPAQVTSPVPSVPPLPSPVPKSSKPHLAKRKNKDHLQPIVTVQHEASSPEFQDPVRNHMPNQVASTPSKKGKGKGKKPSTHSMQNQQITASLNNVNGLRPQEQQRLENRRVRPQHLASLSQFGDISYNAFTHHHVPYNTSTQYPHPQSQGMMYQEMPHTPVSPRPPYPLYYQQHQFQPYVSPHPQQYPPVVSQQQFPSNGWDQSIGYAQYRPQLSPLQPMYDIQQPVEGPFGWQMEQVPPHGSSTGSQKHCNSEMALDSPVPEDGALENACVPLPETGAAGTAIHITPLGPQPKELKPFNWADSFDEDEEEWLQRLPYQKNRVSIDELTASGSCEIGYIILKDGVENLDSIKYTEDDVEWIRKDDDLGCHGFVNPVGALGQIVETSVDGPQGDEVTTNGSSEVPGDRKPQQSNLTDEISMRDAIKEGKMEIIEQAHPVTDIVVTQDQYVQESSVSPTSDDTVVVNINDIKNVLSDEAVLAVGSVEHPPIIEPQILRPVVDEWHIVTPKKNRITSPAPSLTEKQLGAYSASHVIRSAPASIRSASFSRSTASLDATPTKNAVEKPKKPAVQIDPEFLNLPSQASNRLPLHWRYGRHRKLYISGIPKTMTYDKFINNIKGGLIDDIFISGLSPEFQRSRTNGLGRDEENKDWFGYITFYSPEGAQHYIRYLESIDTVKIGALGRCHQGMICGYTTLDGVRLPVYMRDHDQRTLAEDVEESVKKYQATRVLMFTFKKQIGAMRNSENIKHHQATSKAQSQTKWTWDSWVNAFRSSGSKNAIEKIQHAIQVWSGKPPVYYQNIEVVSTNNSTSVSTSRYDSAPGSALVVPGNPVRQTPKSASGDQRECFKVRVSFLRISTADKVMHILRGHHDFTKDCEITFDKDPCAERPVPLAPLDVPTPSTTSKPPAKLNTEPQNTIFHPEQTPTDIAYQSVLGAEIRSATPVSLSVSEAQQTPTSTPSMKKKKKKAGADAPPPKVTDENFPSLGGVTHGNSDTVSAAPRPKNGGMWAKVAAKAPTRPIASLKKEEGINLDGEKANVDVPDKTLNSESVVRTNAP